MLSESQNKAGYRFRLRRYRDLVKSQIGTHNSRAYPSYSCEIILPSSQEVAECPQLADPFQVQLLWYYQEEHRLHFASLTTA
ncbi:hypothetical protein M758_4G088300 [Ceratodon purpureus]|nr:hypothetical protein M758_4G088300 [Ceratodon purpureus]